MAIQPIRAEPLTVLPVVALCGLLLWLAFVHAPGNAKTGAEGPPPASQPETVPQTSPLPAWNAKAPLPAPLMIIAVRHEAVVEMTGLLQAEANLRRLLGEPGREAEVIAASSMEDAERIAESIRFGFGPFATVEYEAIVVQ